MKKNQLITQNINYKYVPEVAKDRFENQILEWWYDAGVDQNTVPFIRNHMIYEEGVARDYLLDLYSEVYEYHYLVGQKRHNPNVFPPPFDLTDTHLEKLHNFRDKNETVIELRFFEDMKRLLQHNKMFFQESYSFDKRFDKPVFHNFPVGKVW